MPRPKANQAKRYGSPVFVLRRSGRIVVPATATFMPETESPYKSQMGGAGFMTRPLKRKWGKVLPDKFKPGRGDKWPTAFIVMERRVEIHGLF